MKWWLQLTSDKREGVRDEGGFICMCPKPTHYTGQDQRYRDEIIETQNNARLIASAPDMLNLLQRVLRIRELIEYPADVGEEFEDEAEILNAMIKSVEEVVENATAL